MNIEMIKRGKWSDNPKEYNTEYNREWREKYPWKQYLATIKQRCKRGYLNNIQCDLKEDDIRYLWERDKAERMESPCIHRLDKRDDYKVNNCIFMERSTHTILHNRERWHGEDLAMKEPEPITKKFIDTLKGGKEPEEMRPRGVGELMESPKESEKGEFKIPCKKCAYWEEKDKHSPIREVYERYKNYRPCNIQFILWNAIKKHCEEG